MKLPEYGIFSPETLLAHRIATNEDQSLFVKRAAILFDKLILIPLQMFIFHDNISYGKAEDYIGGFFPREPSIRKKCLNLFVDFRDVVSNPNELRERLLETTPDDFWSTPDRFNNYSMCLRDVINKLCDHDPTAIEGIPSSFESGIAWDCGGVYNKKNRRIESKTKGLLYAIQLR